MSPSTSMQSFHVVASLPKPVGSFGQYHVGEVYGSSGKARKRKRTELAVGIDGEALNVYDIQYSRLVSSFAISPNSIFTCAPFSVRLKSTTTKAVERRTYASIKEDSGISSSQILLFRECTATDGTTSSSHEACQFDDSVENVAFLGPRISTMEAAGNNDELVAVGKHGSIKGLDPTKLTVKWSSSANVITRRRNGRSPMKSLVEFAQLLDFDEASRGLLKTRQDILSAVPQSDGSGFTSSLLAIIISSSNDSEVPHRTLLTVALPNSSGNATGVGVTFVRVLSSARLPFERKFGSAEVKYQLHVQSGTLYKTSATAITIYDVNEAIPKLQTSISLAGTNSVLRLSSASILTASQVSVTIYNTKFKSLQGSIRIDGGEENNTSSRKRKTEEPLVSDDFRLVSFFNNLETAFAISGGGLVAISVASEHFRPAKRRMTGLLIDSLGRGMSNNEVYSLPSKATGLSAFRSYIPGICDERTPPSRMLVVRLDKLVESKNVDEFDQVICKKHKIFYPGPRNVKINEEAQRKEGQDPVANGISNSADGHKSKGTVKDIGAAWVSYIIGKTFSRSRFAPESEAGSEEVGFLDFKDKLTLSFYPPILMNWIIENGYLTIENVERALKSHDDFTIPSLKAGQLAMALVEVDPDMELLLSLLTNTYLPVTEILCCIRILMQSLEFFGENVELPKILQNPSANTDLVFGEAEIATEEAEAEIDAALALAERQLKQEGSGTRGQALSIALSKLHQHSPASIVRSIQETLLSTEIISLIYLLRFELARGSWTTRYLDSEADEDLSSDSGNSVSLVVNLLSMCIDAIGAGGWLFSNSVVTQRQEGADLISNLKLEVSAAVEGIEEAIYLKGLMSEMVKYGRRIVTATNTISADKKKASWKRKPHSLPLPGQNLVKLPFGMKVEQQISLVRVGAGGEVQRRSARDIGRLKSMKVGKYSIERIDI